MKVTPFTRDLLKALKEERREFMEAATDDAMKLGMTQRQATTFAKLFYAKHRTRPADHMADDNNCT